MTAPQPNGTHLRSMHEQKSVSTQKIKTHQVLHSRAHELRELLLQHSSTCLSTNKLKKQDNGTSNKKQPIPLLEEKLDSGVLMLHQPTIENNVNNEAQNHDSTTTYREPQINEHEQVRNNSNNDNNNNNNDNDNNNNNNANNANNTNTSNLTCSINHALASEQLNDKDDYQNIANDNHDLHTADLTMLANISVSECTGSISSLSDDKMAISLHIGNLFHQKQSFALKTNSFSMEKLPNSFTKNYLFQNGLRKTGGQEW